MLVLVLIGCVSWPDDPSEAVFVVEDIPRFWEAYDAGGDLAGDIDRLYLGPASPGLDAFRRKRFGDAETLAEAVQSDATWYEAVRENTLRVADDDAVLDPLRDAFAAAEAEYPDAFFPDTTFIVGHFGSGGVSLRPGLVVGVEFFTAPEDAPVDTLGEWHAGVVRPVEALPGIVSHEHVHSLQHSFCGPAPTLLQAALKEGVADVLGARWSGMNTNAHIWEYGALHEADLWAEFEADMDGTDTSGWLYQGAYDGDRPPDLGYFVGGRIAEAWLAAHPDAADPIASLLAAHCDADAFLDDSGYAPSGR